MGVGRQHVHGEQRGRVGTHRHESRVSEGKLAHVSVHQVEARGQNDVDAEVHQQHLDVVVEQVELGNGEGQYQPAGEQERHQPRLLHQLPQSSLQRADQTFCTLG
jgi:hypothetical protein